MDGRGMSMISCVRGRFACLACPYKGQTVCQLFRSGNPLDVKGLPGVPSLFARAPVAALGLRRPGNGHRGRAVFEPETTGLPRLDRVRELHPLSELLPVVLTTTHRPKRIPVVRLHPALPTTLCPPSPRTVP